MSISQAIDLLATYPGYGCLRLPFTGRRLDLLQTNKFATVLSACVLLLCSTFDQSLYFRSPDIGFFEHPTIFAFLLGQWLFPEFIITAIDSFITIPSGSRDVLRGDIETTFASQRRWLISAIRRETNASSFVFYLMVGFGLTGWIWNSYQNQHPLEFFHFDFWDSGTLFFGYCATRLYKIYLWCFCFPALAHALLFLILGFRRLFISLAGSSQFTLNPFHEDSCGGVKSLITSVIRPMVPPLMIAMLAVLSAISIHKRLDVTTGLGLVVISVLFLILYAVPASSLRKAIVEEKRRHLREIGRKQASLYQQLLIDPCSIDVAQNAEELIESLGLLEARVKKIPDLPQFAFAVRLASFVGASPVITWLAAAIGDKVISGVLK